MKAAPRIPANLPAAGLGALNSKHVAGGGNNGVRMVAGGKRAGGGRFLGWGNRWGWSGCFSPLAPRQKPSGPCSSLTAAGTVCTERLGGVRREGGCI